MASPLPPDTRAVGTGNPPADMNQVVDALTGMNEQGWIKPSGDTTGATDTANINASLAARQFTTLNGTYYINAALTPPSNSVLDGLHGGIGTATSPTSIIAVAGFPTGHGMIEPGLATEVQVKNLILDGSLITAGTCYGVNGVSSQYVKLTDLEVLGDVNKVNTGLVNGIRQNVSTVNPFGWHVERVNVRYASGSAFNLVSGTDATWIDCQSSTSGADGWIINGCQNSRWIGCRGDRDVNSGFHVTGSGWGTGSGSGGGIFIGCSSDRCGQNGFLIDSTGTGPHMITGNIHRRDGSDGNAARAGLKISACTNPVAVVNLGVFPGVEDNGTGNNGPALALSVSGSSSVTVENSYLQGVTTSVSNGGTNTYFYVGPGVVQATGTTASPVNTLAPSAGWLPTPADQGYAGWTYDPTYFAQAIAGTALTTAGVVYLCQIPVRVPTAVADIRIYITTAGGTLTAGQCFAGLYNSAGTKIGATADQAANWAGTGLLDAALSGGPFTVTPPFVWAAFLFNGTTGPALARMNALANGMANGKLAAASARYGSILTAQTSLPSSITPGSIALTATEWWAAIW